MTDLVRIGDVAPLPTPIVNMELEIDALAERYLQSDGTLIQIVTFIGGQVEDAVGRLPASARSRIDEATRIALETAYGAARGTHRKRAMGDRMHRNAAMFFGAVGGVGGLPSAIAELPVTTTMILRSIQEIAGSHGEDIGAEETRLACLQVLGSGGPLAEDDGTDFAFLGARLTMTGAALNSLMAQVAPRFATALTQKLAAKAVPALGSAAGAATNFAFTRYYQDMAYVHFGLRRLARQGAFHAPAAFRGRVEQVRAIRRA